MEKNPHSVSCLFFPTLSSLKETQPSSDSVESTSGPTHNGPDFTSRDFPDVSPSTLRALRTAVFLSDPHRGKNGDLGEIRVCGAQLKRWRWHPLKGKKGCFFQVVFSKNHLPIQASIFSNGFWFQKGFPVAKCDSMKACDIYLFASLPVSERILTTPKCSLQ